MKNNSNPITIEEAQLTLDSLESTKRSAILSLRPPLWLNALSTSFLAMFTLSMAWAGHENLWFLVTIFSMIVFVCTFFIWFHRLYNMGMTPKTYPTKPLGIFALVAKNALFLTLILGTRELYTRGIAWAPFAGAAILCTTYSFWWHHFPTNERASKGNTH